MGRGASLAQADADDLLPRKLPDGICISVEIILSYREKTSLGLFEW